MRRGRAKAAQAKPSLRTGYYWAKWQTAVEGTRDASTLTPSDTWEIVQLTDLDEDAAVAVAGVEKWQRRDCFIWGRRVADLHPPEGECA
ncbi:hypothetical protein [Camelimonas lactis]|uniref:Uncharacterized protein n=1 Tax=Camelimonas lactis TaxID=659006 RepID=A0A4R2H087_9HYPH|nr:hypothetical protein [Camelimonas lactis]TCO15853.1 hypothetical protein EV666_101102 [Camelimonas lactis]